MRRKPNWLAVDGKGHYCQHEKYADEKALRLHLEHTAAEQRNWSELTKVTDNVVLGPLSDEFLNSDVGKGVIRFLPWKRVVT